MITRLWFVLSLAWAALFFYNCTTRQTFSFDSIDAILVFGPLVAGLVIRLLYRYVRYGPAMRPRSF